MKELFGFAQRRALASILSGALVLTGGVELINNVIKPPTYSQIETCGRAIGRKALYQDGEPHPQCDGLDQFFPPRGSGVKPITATEFQTQASGFEGGLKTDEKVLEGVILVAALGLSVAIAKIQPNNPD